MHYKVTICLEQMRKLSGSAAGMRKSAFVAAGAHPPPISIGAYQVPVVGLPVPSYQQHYQQQQQYHHHPQQQQPIGANYLGEPGNQPPQPRGASDPGSSLSGWMWVSIFVFLAAAVVIIMLAVTGVFTHTVTVGTNVAKADPATPSPSTTTTATPATVPPTDEPFRDASSSSSHQEGCMTDESYDERVKMCMMNPHYPQAISTAIMNPSVSPCDDFYKYACGKWIDEHVNENRGFTGLAAVNDALTKQIVLDPAVPDVHNLFLSCDATLVSKKSRNWKNHKAETSATRDFILKRMLEPFRSMRDLPLVFGRMGAAGYTLPVAFLLQGNPHPSSHGIIPVFAWDGFVGLDKDLDWVIAHFEEIYGTESVKARTQAVRLINMVNKLNVGRPDKEGLLDTQEGWRAYLNTTLHRDTMTYAQFKALSSLNVFDWKLYTDTIYSELKLSPPNLKESQQVWVMSRSYFEWLRFDHFTMDQWRLFITWSVLYHTHEFFPALPNDVLLSRSSSAASGNEWVPPPSPPSVRTERVRRLSNRKMRLPIPPEVGVRRRAWQLELRKAELKHVHSRISRRTFENIMSGKSISHTASSNGGGGSGFGKTEEIPVTTEDCIRATKYLLPGIVSKVYLERNFKQSNEIRQRVIKVVEKIRDQFVKNILETPWMDNRTRVLQAEKIRSIVPRVVQPNHWEEEKFEQGSEMDPARYLRNLNVIQQDRVRRNLILWSESNYGEACGPTCRDKITAFGSPLSIVNAWYNPDRNLITIPAGILQPPFFDNHYDDVSVYATIGMVVAHELSHAQDPHGSLFDKDGAMRDTWSPEAREEYRKRAMCLVREYGTPEGCEIENYGEQTLCENTADAVGLGLAYDALDPKTVEEQRAFFLSFGQMWCSSYTPEVLCARASDDVHSTAEWRVRKTLAHSRKFAVSHGCSIGTPMHREDHKMCIIFGKNALNYDPLTGQLML